jgi:small subunit ribosomal protein S2
MLFIFSQFIKYKIYIGHSYKNTKFLSSWILYRLQNNIWIIDIFKTIFFLKNIVTFLKYLISYGLPIWFINLEITKEFMFLMYSRLCGEFACTRYWIRGMLSNYLSISKSIRKYGLKKIVYKSSIFLKIINNWHITRYTWPRAIFVTNINSNYIICNEAISMFLPIIAIIDSNVKSFLVKFPIISNDDSMESFYFIFNIISKLILLLKYKKLILWFFKYKRIIKEINFKKLINHLYYVKKINLKKIFKPLNLFNKFNWNLKKIENFYKNNFNLNYIFFKKNIIYFDLKFIKKKLYFFKYNQLSKYKHQFMFKNKLNLNVSRNIKNVLSSLNRRKKNNNYFIKKLKNITKYFILYWTSFVYSVKNLRIFYNSFDKNKKNNNFLNLKYLYNLNKKLDNLKFMYFPFFFFIKKRNSFFKTILSNYSNYQNTLDNRLFFFNNYYIKIFIELYYNKWFLYLLNSNLN